jgi:RNA polymerase sigma-70 factor (ECF subfamily)
MGREREAGPAGRHQFPTTSLGMVWAAAGQGPRSREALETLCGTYWYPLYAFFRRQVHDPEEARDLTQAFFTQVMERDTLRRFERERGRFRSFLLVCAKHFLINERHRAVAAKRGGGLAPVSLDVPLEGAETRYRLEPGREATPERIFEQGWAREVLARAMERLRLDCARRGRAAHFERLRDHLVGDGDATTYRELGEGLGMSEGAIKVAIHRLRERFHQSLREEIALTVGRADEVGAEIRYLVSVLRSS